MDKKITRRVVLGTVITGLAAGPFVLRSYRSRLSGLSVNKLESVSSYFTNPVVLDMPDVSNFERKIESVISLASLFTGGARTIRLLYEVETMQSARLTQDEQVLRDWNSQSPVPKQILKREMVYTIPEISSSNEIAVEQRDFIDGQKGSKGMLPHHDKVQFVVTPDGWLRNRTHPDLFPRESSARYLSSPVKVGSEWEQIFAVDERLNPGGSVPAKYKVTSSFSRNGEDFFRIERELRFKAFQPVIDSKTGVASFDAESKNTMDIRAFECFDLNLDKGYSTCEKGRNVIYFDSPDSDGNGFLTIAEMMVMLKSPV